MIRLVLASAPWAERLYEDTLRWLPGEWEVARTLDELGMVWTWAQPGRCQIIALHWHWLLPELLVTRPPCIGFHASDLPHFRGGSPIDNQIKRGIFDTQLTAFRMDAGLDTGPILMKRPLSLRGTREEIMERIAGLVARMMPRLLYDPPSEVPQGGAGSFYTRADAQ